MGALEFDVMAEHRGELLWLQLAVVGPRRLIFSVNGLLSWVSAVVRLWFDRSLTIRFAGAGDGIGAELGVTEAFGCVGLSS
jgi:hypothetical protein